MRIEIAIFPKGKIAISIRTQYNFASINAVWRKWRNTVFRHSAKPRFEKSGGGRPVFSKTARSEPSWPNHGDWAGVIRL